VCPRNETVIGAEKGIDLQGLSRSKMKGIQFLEARLVQDDCSGFHLGGEGKVVRGVAQEVGDSIAPRLVGDPLNLEHQYRTANKLVGARCYHCKNGQHSLRLQKDPGLALVIERPVQAAGVEIDKHGGLLLVTHLLDLMPDVEPNFRQGAGDDDVIQIGLHEPLLVLSLHGREQ
jgi:hypothetical protein